jgi:tRNA A-37 threonylcarbamoyl transferase component Bud32
MVKLVDDGLPPELLRSMDPVCDAFELALREGRRPVIEEQLGAVADSVQPLLLVELIRTEMEWSYRLGQQPAAEDYCRRFPGCAGTVEHWLEEARTAAEQVTGSGGQETDGPDFPRTSTFQGGQAAEAWGALPAVGLPSVLGEYELLGQLGAGGMGEVHKARHRRLDKLVALKVLHTRSLRSDEGTARFLREMKAIGGLDHPNVVEAHDAGEQGGIVYLVMKLIDGTDLARRVQKQGPLPVAEACDCVRQAALGLQYLHERGLVHRDIKPSNLMRTADGTVKILDLGLARWRAETSADSDLTGVGQVMGTPDYLAPEQIRGASAVDIRADLYALGGTLFYLLTGRAPFAHHKEVYEKLKAQQEEPPPDVCKLRPEVPAAVAELVRRLLAKKPLERPQTPATVAAALADFAQSPQRQQGPAPDGLAIRPFLGQRRHWLAAGAAALAVLLGVAAVAFFRRDRGEKQPSPANTGKVEILSLEVMHFVNVDGKFDDAKFAGGLLGVKSFTTHLGDAVTVEARLSRLAYAYLIAFRPDGIDEVCFPEKKDEKPPLTDRPRYPSVSRGDNYGLTDGEGLTVFALVVSSQPLPAYKEWRGRLSASPWKRNSPTPPGIVWYDDGVFVEALTAEGRNRGSRGKGQEAPGKSQVVAVADWLRQAPEVEAVAVVGFAVLPAVKP